MSVRLHLNRTRGSFDLAGTIRSYLEKRPVRTLLDIGSASGSLLFSYLPADRPIACTAIDISKEGIDRIGREAATRGIRLEASVLDMDALIDPAVRPELMCQSVICAAYSLYYSRRPEALIAGLARRIAADGCLVVAAPGPGNNLGWFGFLGEAGVAVPEAILRLGEHFVPRTAEPAARKRFRRVRVGKYRNDVLCESPDLLYEYWRSNIYFDAAYDDRVRFGIARHFRRRSSFLITKEVTIVFAEAPT